ncbi:MAG: groES [Dehalococcoidia bacterium]|nr:groES [Dehalococcoidia bacterium]
MATQVQPLGDRVLVKALEKEEISSGGIFIPDTAQDRPQEGEVIAVGPGRVADDGKRIAMELAKGDKVMFSKYAGTEVKLDGNEYLIFRESDIFAKVTS